jgi:dihydrofolate reductase
MPSRISYVVTSRPESCPEAHGYLSGNICEKIVELQHKHPEQQVWIIGGLGLLEQTLGIIDQFYLSRIPGSYLCDRALPLGLLSRWAILFEEQHSEVTFQILTPPQN